MGKMPVCFQENGYFICYRIRQVYEIRVLAAHSGIFVVLTEKG